MSQANGVVNFIRAAGSGAGDVSDAELVRRFASIGDEQAFRTLVARYGPVVWSVCRRLVRDHHDAEDAFQATLLVFARKAGDLRAGAAVGGWLHAVAYRVASRVRSARRAEPTEAEPADGTRGALDELTVREAEAALHEELARLPEKYRAPLVLCCLEGLSRDEAALRLGWPASRIKHGLEQGRELLRARLSRRGIALGVPLLTGLLASPAGAVPPALVESALRYATGATAPPAAVHSLANGVTRTMSVAKWKWAVAGCAALALTAGGLAASLRGTAEAPSAPTAHAEPLFAPRAPAPEPKKEPPKPAWDVATEYLQFIIGGKPEQAVGLGNKLDDKFTKWIQSGFKRVRFVMILVNDSRVMVVTEPTELTLTEENDEFKASCLVTIALDRKDADSPWRVGNTGNVCIWIKNETVLAHANDFLEGKFNFKQEFEEEKPKEKPVWEPATEFLKLAVAGKTADALKLTVPGTISENKVKEMKEIGVIQSKPVAILLNDTRIEVAFQQQKIKNGDRPETTGHLVLTLTKSKDGAWRVKDIDLRNADAVEQRVKLYLDGKYNTPAPKP